MKAALIRFKVITLMLVSMNLWSVNDAKITSNAFPQVLSEFEFFIDQTKQLPAKNVHPYELITTLFSDYSYKSRFVYVPEGKEGSYQKDWVYDFPVGTALIKTFYYPVDERNAHFYKGHDVFNLRAKIPLNENLNFGFSLSNLTDEKYATRADYAFGSYRYFGGHEREFHLSLEAQF